MTMDRPDMRDEMEEAADVEELEPLEELAELETGVNSLPAESPLLSESGPRCVVRSYDAIPEPLALLDDSLAFIYRNQPFNTLLKAFGYPDTSSFLGTLARSIDSETARSIYDGIGKAESGHAWKGTISHRSKDSAAVITKVHIFPLWPDEATDGKPPAYSVYLDDVTEENRKFLRDMFSSLLEASKLKDNDTGKHIERVNLYSAILAKELFNDSRRPDVDTDFVDNIGFLAAMHDVGKIVE